MTVAAKEESIPNMKTKCCSICISWQVTLGWISIFVFLCVYVWVFYVRVKEMCGMMKWNEMGWGGVVWCGSKQGYWMSIWVCEYAWLICCLFLFHIRVFNIQRRNHGCIEPFHQDVFYKLHLWQSWRMLWPRWLFLLLPWLAFQSPWLHHRQRQRQAWHP